MHCDRCVTQAVGKRLTWYQSCKVERKKKKALVRETLGVEKMSLEDFGIRFIGSTRNDEESSNPHI